MGEIHELFVLALSLVWFAGATPESRSKFSISIEIFNLARKFQSRRLDFPTNNRAAVGCALEKFTRARNFQSRSKSRIFLIFGPSGLQIRANRLILANRFRVPELNPFFCESLFGGLKIANRRFEAIRAKFAANCSHVMNMEVSLRINSRESPRFALRIAGPSKSWVSMRPPFLGFTNQYAARKELISGPRVPKSLFLLFSEKSPRP